MMMKEMLKRFQVAISLAEDTAHPNLSSPRKGGMWKMERQPVLGHYFLQPGTTLLDGGILS